MKKNQGTIMEFLTRIPIVSTDQVARFFSDNGSPNKRASEALTTLEAERIIEGRRREIGKAKVWRLTKKGRDMQGITRPPTPLQSMKTDHILSIGDAYLDLLSSGKLSRWTTELRETYRIGNKERKYCPDAFFVFEGKPYLLEVQRSPLSVNRWGEKWNVATEFFDGGHYMKASFQLWEGKTIRPRIAVITDQAESQVTAGAKLPLLILKSGADLVLYK